MIHIIVTTLTHFTTNNGFINNSNYQIWLGQQLVLNRDFEFFYSKQRHFINVYSRYNIRHGSDTALTILQSYGRLTSFYWLMVIS